MMRRSKAQWQAIIKQQSQSGLTAAAYCREHGINPKTFSLRKRQAACTESSTDPQLPTFVPVKLNPNPGNAAVTLTLQLGPALLRLPSDTDSRWLANLLSALQG